MKQNELLKIIAHTNLLILKGGRGALTIKQEQMVRQYLKEIEE
jgi:hypothetical protein